MNRKLFIGLTLAAALAGPIAEFVVAACRLAEPATCKGEDPCKACKTCDLCKNCNKDGGSCSVCSKPTSPDKPVHQVVPAIGTTAANSSSE
jgi:hypothetical protein